MAEKKPSIAEVITFAAVREDTLTTSRGVAKIIKVTDQNGRELTHFTNTEQNHAVVLPHFNSLLGKNAMVNVQEPLGRFPKIADLPVPTEMPVTPPTGESAQKKEQGNKGGGGGYGRSPHELHCTMFDTCIMKATELVIAKMQRTEGDLPSIVSLRNAVLQTASLWYSHGSKILPNIGASLPGSATVSEDGQQTLAQDQDANLATADDDGIPF